VDVGEGGDREDEVARVVVLVIVPELEDWEDEVERVVVLVIVPELEDGEDEVARVVVLVTVPELEDGKDEVERLVVLVMVPEMEDRDDEVERLVVLEGKGVVEATGVDREDEVELESVVFPTRLLASREGATYWYKERPLGPPQISVALPAHIMLHLPSVAATDPAATVLPQKHSEKTISTILIRSSTLTHLCHTQHPCM
jgi:hypothetical protein